MKEGQELITKKEAMDKNGWIIPADTTITIKKLLHNPITKKEDAIILIDNGTGIKELYPKTVIEADILKEAI